MKNLKYTFLILFLMSFSYELRSETYSISNECDNDTRYLDEAFSFEVERPNSDASFSTLTDSEIETGLEDIEVVREILNMLKKIMALQFEIVDLSMNNKEIYGSFISANEMKQSIEKQIGEVNLIISENTDKVINFKASTTDQCMSSDLQSKLGREFLSQIRNNLRAYRKSLKNLEKELIGANEDYHLILQSWAPFRDRLSLLENTRKNLLDTYEIMKSTLSDSRNKESDSLKIPDLKKIFIKKEKPIFNKKLLDSHWLKNEKNLANKICKYLKEVHLPYKGRLQLRSSMLAQ